MILGQFCSSSLHACDCISAYSQPIPTYCPFSASTESQISRGTKILGNGPVQLTLGARERFAFFLGPKKMRLHAF